MFKDKLKQLRKDSKYSMDALAEIYNNKFNGKMNKSTLSRYENGIQEPMFTVVKNLATIFGVSTDYLIDQPVLKGAIPYEPDKMIPIPVIGRVAAGLTCLADMDIKCYELVDRDTICTGYDYIYLKVKGDSMEPLILEDDLVLVRIQSIVDSGDYAVVIVNGDDGLVKKINIEKNCITLMSENPYYPPRKFEKEAMNDIRIFGKVVESKRKF